MPSEFTKGFTKTFEGSFQTGQRIGASAAELRAQQKERERIKQEERAYQEEQYRLKIAAQLQDEKRRAGFLKDTLNKINESHPDFFSDRANYDLLSGMIDAGYHKEALDVLTKVHTEKNDMSLDKVRAAVAQKIRQVGYDDPNVSDVERHIYDDTFELSSSGSSTEEERKRKRVDEIEQMLKSGEAFINTLPISDQLLYKEAMQQKAELEGKYLPKTEAGARLRLETAFMPTTGKKQEEVIGKQKEIFQQAGADAYIPLEYYSPDVRAEEERRRNPGPRTDFKYQNPGQPAQINQQPQINQSTTVTAPAVSPELQQNIQAVKNLERFGKKIDWNAVATDLGISPEELEKLKNEAR